MKKAFVAIGIFLVIFIFVKFLALRSGTNAAVVSVRQEAISQHMPTDFFGVEWLASFDDVKRLRPNTILINSQELSEQEKELSEQVEYLNRKAKVTYFFQNNVVMMFIITFSDIATLEDFSATQTILSRDYGSMTDITSISDENGPRQCSYNESERFRIDHCIRKLGSAYQEQLVFYRTGKKT
ncbi:MAG TPA: hypothetical protein PKY89_00495 [Deltaproteobacteria bacterium]|nr:hypothetical protein [Deltaproteobacteria bacterium]